MYSAHVEIAASPSRVFAVLTDHTVLKDWTPEIVEAKPLEGGLRVGASSHALVEEFGRRFDVQLVIVGLEPDARIAYDMRTPMWSGHVEYVLTHRPGGTNLSMSFVPEPPQRRSVRVLARGLAPLTRPLVQRRLRQRLEALRRIIETRT